MQGKRGSPRGHSPHPQAAPRLLSRLVLPLLHNACDAILYFSAVWAVSARLTTVPWWIKSGDYKNIQMDQIGFQESLNQSKLKNCKRTKPLGYLWRKKKKGGRSRQGRRVAVAVVVAAGGGSGGGGGGGGREGESKPRLFLGNTSVKCHSINYWMIEGNLTVFATIQQERGGYNG